VRPSSTFSELDKNTHDRKSFVCGAEELDTLLTAICSASPGGGDKQDNGAGEQYGFQLLDTHNHRTRLFLPMKTVAQLFADDV